MGGYEMHTRPQSLSLHRIIFQSDLESRPLYFHAEGVKVNLSSDREPSLEFCEGARAHFKTFFNAFPESHLQHLARAPESTLLRVRGRGRFQIKLFRSVSGLGPDQLLVDQLLVFENRNDVEFTIPYRMGRMTAGLLSFSLEAKSIDAAIFGADWCVSAECKVREVQLGIVVCTFKREEYLKKTVKNIERALPGLANAQVFIIDHGATIEASQFPSEIHLIRQPNIGGSGGFGRGMREVAQRPQLSHTLLMDDDIEVDPEMILRTAHWYEVLREGVAISGGMFDSKQRCSLWEAGAFYEPGRLVPRMRTFSDSDSCKSVLELARPGFAFALGRPALGGGKASSESFFNSLCTTCGCLQAFLQTLFFINNAIISCLQANPSTLTLRISN